MSGPFEPSNGSASDDVDFDRLENEASKVFALWELMEQGDAAAGLPAAAAPAAAHAPESVEPHEEGWAAASAQTQVDAPTLQAMQAAMAPAAMASADMAPAAMASAASAEPPAAVVLTAGPSGHATSEAGAALAPRTLEDLPVSPAAAPIAGAAATAAVTPDAAEASVPLVWAPAPQRTAPAAATPVAPPAPMPASSAPLNIVPFPEPAQAAYAMDDAPPMKRVSPLFWAAAVVVLLGVGGGGLYWLEF